MYLSSKSLILMCLQNSNNSSSTYLWSKRETARGSIPGGNGVFTELHVLRKGQWKGVPSLNDLAVDGT